MPAPLSVPVGEHTVPLITPASYTVRYEVWTSGVYSEVRAACAALGLCWGDRATAPKARYEATYSVYIYGGQVLDELVARGIPAREVLAAGGVAYRQICSEWAPTEQEIAAAEDFSAAPEPSTV